MNPTSVRNNGAFSLVELLVVISIVGVLIAMLMPAIKQAKDVSHVSACASNLRQIAVAENVYCTNMADGAFPWSMRFSGARCTRCDTSR